MNDGVLGFPSRRFTEGPTVRALLVLDASTPPSAGLAYSRQYLLASHNIERVIYNATGDFTVYFIEPMPSVYFATHGTAKQSGSTEYIVTVDTSDSEMANQKRISVNTTGGTATNVARVFLTFTA